MSARTIERVGFPGPVGQLVGILQRPDGEAAFAAIVSHPHPLFGGTMDNKVVHRVARALEGAGGLVLRFNFRGAGGSEGAHDAGRGEQDDLRAAWRFLEERGGAGLPVLLAGFSFGGAVSSKVATSDPARVAGLLLVGAPSRSTPFTELHGATLPVAFVQGSIDEHGPVEALRALGDRLAGPSRLEIVEGAGHFFDDQQEQLHDAVQRVLASGLYGPAFAERLASARS